MIKKILLNSLAFLGLLFSLFFADQVRKQKPLTLFGSEKFTILSLDPGAELELTSAFVLNPDASEEIERKREIGYERIIKTGLWQTADSGLKSSEINSTLRYKYPPLSRADYVFCFRVSGGNAVIEHISPGKHETVTLSETDYKCVSSSGLQGNDPRRSFPVYYLCISLLLTVVFIFAGAQGRNSYDWKSRFYPETDRDGINIQFQLLKVIGILLIVANHKKSCIPLFYSFFPAYSFHVFLFVFISGYFYKESCEQDIKKLLWKKAKKLLVPLYLWNFTYAIISVLLSKAEFSFNTEINFDSLFLAPLYNGGQFALNAPIWFVAPLFFTESAIPMIRKMLGKIFRGTKKDWACSALSLGLGVLGVYLADLGWHQGWGLALTRLLVFLPFYHAGYLYKAYLEKRDTLPNFLYFSLIFGLSLVFIWTNGGTKEFSPYSAEYKGFTLWPFLLGLLGIAFWLRVTRILSLGLKHDRFIHLAADSSFSIMIHQYLGFFLVNTVYAACMIFSDTLCRDFDLQKYHKDVFYTYVPGGIEQTKLIYTVAGIAIGILLKLILDRVRAHLFSRISPPKQWFLYSGLAVLLVLGAYGVSSL